MVKSSHDHQPSSSPPAVEGPCKYKGVRKRKWGKYVSEIRLPNCRQRIWLGSYDTAEKAARAFDAALYCLRGRTAKFNFPENPPEILNGRSLTPAEIQVAAAQFAHRQSIRVEENHPEPESQWSDQSLSSPCPSVSDGHGAAQTEGEMSETPLDNAFMDQFLNMDTEGNNVLDLGLFPGFDDFSGEFMLPLTDDYWPDNNQDLSSQDSFLWNF